MNHKLLILSGIQLSTNPRVVKEADTLSEAGYEVEVVGALLDSALAERDSLLSGGKAWKYTVLLDASGSALRDRLKWYRARLRTRLWREAGARLGATSPNQLGYVAPEMLRYALGARADLTILHLPQALWVGTELIRLGRAVGIDVEDWYSEDLLPQDRNRWPVEALRRWERLVLRGASYSTTTSQSLSRALATAYDCPRPAVVFNSFPMKERNLIDGKIRDRVDVRLPSLTWFSQVVGPGRGLETLMDALPQIGTAFEIHLRGKCRDDYRAALLERVPEPWRSRIYFHPQVPHAELLSRIAEHDVGLAAEVAFCRNHALTISNKIVQYLLAGIAVAASDTEGQREAAEMAKGAVFLFAAGDAQALAAVLSELFSNPAHRHAARVKALAAAQGEFCWDNSARVLLDEVGEAIRQRSRGLQGGGRAASGSG